MSSPHISLRVARGKHILNSHLLNLYNSSHFKQGQGDVPELPKKTIPPLESFPGGHGLPKGLTGPACIIGAGAAGLQAAMILPTLGITDITILEASDRVGGRAYTHQFPPDSNCKHNYYDMGAMRIPDIPSMQPTLDLVKILQMANPPLTNPPQLTGYTMKNDSAPNMYYYTTKAPDDSPFKNRIQWLLDEYGFSTAKTEAELAAAFEAYFSSPSGWDNYSCRAWLMASLTYVETQIAEMQETSSGLLDQALTEMMIDYSDFQAAEGPSIPWYRIEGTTGDPNNPLTGMSALTEAMREYIINSGGPDVTLNSPVVQMSEKDSDQITVTWGNTVATQQSKDFNLVISTTALGCLQRMDLQGLNLDPSVQMGIRSLSYDRATKVAIKFTDRWWMNSGLTGLGGVSACDLPISNIVYPSWDDGDNAQNYILMASYSWAQDATRMASLVQDYPNAEVKNVDDPLVTLCLQNLVKLFQTNGHPEVTYETLSQKYISHHAWSWSRDPWTAGAFALFGPGQFQNIYRDSFTKFLCNGNFLIAGEAMSVHHAWISGAIDSVVLQVARWAMAKGGMKSVSALKRTKFGGGVDKFPQELDETLLYWSVKLHQGTVKGEEL
ncbi:hypothetical protein P154DRAFT_549918 [Amniculicola lignicola CBS 123094]|uniref:Amine oxidase domain-containing protein n=1 Tax=Amniculicola lignicola CBS 123094 TaxID=1392246 RepID=A0A6A5VUW0_9PLEO|nr:hypothetical protein P154DRAFT_549918 [Amniculicola lignicola CBS 123094]